LTLNLSVTVAFLAVTLIPPCQADEMLAVSPSERIANRSQEEWSAQWWMWAGSFDYDDSPVADRTGVRCDFKQKGPVWFLAGTYGTRRTERTCRIPKDKYLFFPLINYIVMPAVASNRDCEAQTATAAAMTDNPSALILDVDGIRVEALARYRQATTSCFDMGALRTVRVAIYPSAANGYYVMLRPLSPGRHVVNFGGELPGMLQAVTYTLDVE
jgi:hypothetical protein